MPNPFWPFQRVILDDEVQSSDAATKIVKLPLSNYLHTLYVRVACTNGATSALNQTINDVVDKIEVVANGSDVLVSLTPREIKRWTLWLTGTNIPQLKNERASAVQFMTFPIFFGRSAFDPEYFLPCARLSDLEVRITYSPTIAATSFATGTTTIGVYALMSMGSAPGPYRGTFSHKTLSAFTSAASGDTQTLIPRGNLLRQLMVYAYEAATEDGVNISRVKFDLNNNERQMYDIDWNDLQDVNKIDNWVVHEEAVQAFTKNADTIDTEVATIKAAIMQTAAAFSDANDEVYLRYVTTISGDRVTVEGVLVDNTAGAESDAPDTALRNTQLLVHGSGVSHAVILDFAKAGEDSVINTSEFDQVRCTLTQGNAGADVRISSQEVRML